MPRLVPGRGRTAGASGEVSARRRVTGCAVRRPRALGGDSTGCRCTGDAGPPTRCEEGESCGEEDEPTGETGRPTDEDAEPTSGACGAPGGGTEPTAFRRTRHTRPPPTPL